MTKVGSVEGRCLRCGAPATCRPSKGWWCPHCRNGLTRADLDAASRFSDCCCYDDRVRMPSTAAMDRLAELGIVEVLKTGVYAETPLLRQLGL